MQATIAHLSQEMDDLKAFPANSFSQFPASIPQFDDYFQEVASNPLSDLRAQNPFEEKSFVDDMIAEVQSIPTDFQEVNDFWFKSALTKSQGLLFDSKSVEISFIVNIQKLNTALTRVIIKARSPVVVRTAEAVDNVVGTVRIEMGFR